MYQYKGNEPGIKARMGRARTPDDPSACGTPTGIWQHKRAGQPNCDKCRKEATRIRKVSRVGQMANILAQEQFK